MPYNIPGIHIVVQSDRNHIVVPLTEAVEVTPDPPYVASIILWTDTGTGDPTLKATAQVLDQYGNGVNGQTVTFTIIASSNAIGTGFFNPTINTLSITATALTANGDFLPASGVELRDGVAIAPYIGTSNVNKLLPWITYTPATLPQIVLRASCGGVLVDRTEYIFIGVLSAF